VAPGGGGKSRQAIATRTIAPGAVSAWRYERSRQAVVADFVSFEAFGAWRYVSPARRSESCSV